MPNDPAQHHPLLRQAVTLADAIPRALRTLREQAGHASLRNATEAVFKATGKSMSPGSISEWERGKQFPRLDTALVYLTGLGVGFHELQRALEQSVVPDAAQELAARLRGEPGMRDQLRSLVERTSLDPQAPSGPAAELVQLLEALESEEKGGAGESGPRPPSRWPRPAGGRR